MDGARNRPVGIIFDLGGVLLSFDHMIICRGLSSVCGIAPDEVYKRIFASGLEALYDTGLPTGEFFEKVLEALNVSVPSAVFRKIWCDIFSENPDVVDILRGLKGKTRLFLLSNTNELHFEFVRERFRFLDLFDGLFLSYRLGVRKPDMAVFKKVIELTGLPRERLLYIDDKAEHVSAGRLAGIEGVVFRSARELSEELVSRGL